LKKLYVGNLPFSATEDEITEMFGAHGTVHSVALINDRECSRPAGRVGGIDLPVSGLLSSVDMLGAICDEDPTSDTESGLLAVPARQAFAMGFGQPGDQFPSLEINPLVDRFMADSGRVTFVSKSTGDLLRRPASLEAASDILSQEWGLETGTAVTLLPTEISIGLGPVWQVAVRCTRDSIALQLS